MAELTGGTVTLLFTDIEGSTRLWEEQPQAMRAALGRHDEILRGAIESNHGVVFKTVGDAFCAAFASPADAVRGALTAQIALRRECWPEAANLLVRMALHTGPVELRQGDYLGPALNRTARLLAAAHGGQVLLSDATAGQVDTRLPARARLQDLGEHRLRDLAQPQRIARVEHPDLPSVDAPLRSLQAFRHNLPVQRTSFVGREREIAEVRSLLETTRLLTLTGTGGSGKTRLSLQVGAELLEAFGDGVWLVEFAALTDGSLVPYATASALGIREETGRTLLATLIDKLASRNLLLILDNCEHLISTCAALADRLLRECPAVRLLATSREPLDIPGETAYRLPSLSIADPDRLPPTEALLGYEPVQLFVDRATSASLSFALTAHNARAVARICHRLDGIPLAIELAAARVRALPVDTLAERIGDRFALLTQGSRSAMPRQQTLRALIDWSHDLLSEAERTLFRRLAVFNAGWTVEAAENVCADSPTPPYSHTPAPQSSEILDLLTSLVDKSLADYDAHASRYRLLETVRQYAGERLREAGDSEIIRLRHLQFFLRLAEECEPGVEGPDQSAWLDRLDADLGNLRGALEWSMAPGELGHCALRCAGALFRFWHRRGHLAEGRSCLERALACTDFAGSERAKALNAASYLAYFQGDYIAAESLAAEALAIGRNLGDSALMSVSINKLATAIGARGDIARAIGLYERNLALSRELDDQRGIASTLNNLGWLTSQRGDYPTARALLDESAATWRAVGDEWCIAHTLSNLSLLALKQKDPGARGFAEESITLWRQVGDPLGIAWGDLLLARLRSAEGDLDAAAALARQSLARLQELGVKDDVVAGIEVLGEVSLACRMAERAARLFGASEAFREQMQMPLLPDEREPRDRQLAALRNSLGEAAFNALWLEGRSMSLEQAVACALDEEPTSHEQGRGAWRANPGAAHSD